MAAHTAPAANDIEIVDMNLTVIATLSSDDIDWGTVRQVTQCIEDCLLRGVPRAREEYGTRIEKFRLVVGNRPMHPDLYVLDHFERPIRYPLRIQIIKAAPPPSRDPSSLSSEHVFSLRCIRSET